jgi:WD40 repeat protein
MEPLVKGAMQVRIILSTKHHDVQLPENTGAILVSTSLRRYALSTLINNLIGRTERPIPFEFLANGRFLKSSIEDYLNTSGTSSEDILPLEYVKASLPPVNVTSLEHPRWVHSVDVLSASSPAAAWQGRGGILTEVGDAKILSGGSDGIVRVWSASTNELLAQSSALSEHSQVVKMVKFLTPSLLVATGYDGVVRIWKYDHEHAHQPGDDPRSILPSKEFHGHKHIVNSVSVHLPSSRILSASSDHTVGLWTIKLSEAPPAPEILPSRAGSTANKRQKLNAAPNVPQRGPLALLKGHTDNATAACFSEKDHTVGYSTSWDGTLITWDLATEKLVSSCRAASDPAICLADLGKLGLLVVGTSRRNLHAVDPRVDAKSSIVMTFQGHSNEVFSVAAEPEGSGGSKIWGLVSGSGDGTCRVWDLRNIRSNGSDAAVAAKQVCESIFTLHRRSLGGSKKMVYAGEGVKVFGVCWDGEVGIVSASADKHVQVDQSLS